MGGYNSGRRNGRPIAEDSMRIDLAWMIRNARAVPGHYVSGVLRWSSRGASIGSISYVADMCDGDSGRLTLSYRRGKSGDMKEVEQVVPLSCTPLYFGGRRWWMHCPISKRRVGKLYLPLGGDVFASRGAWRLGYRSQRVSGRDKPFERLFRLQRKLGHEEGWEAGLRRPKGMWQRTFERHFDRYIDLEGECDMIMQGLLERTGIPAFSA